MSPRDELLRLLTPPGEKWAVPSRSEIAQAYEAGLPSDFLWLMETYGPGEISDYLGILPPVSASVIGKVSGVSPTKAEPDEGVEGIEPEYLVRGGLLVWGYNPDGDGAFWSTVGEPDDWPIVVFRRHPNCHEPAWSRYDCGIVGFLVSTFQGRLERNPFSGTDLWLNEDPKFVRG